MAQLHQLELAGHKRSGRMLPVSASKPPPQSTRTADGSDGVKESPLLFFAYAGLERVENAAPMLSHVDSLESDLIGVAVSLEPSLAQFVLRKDQLACGGG